MFRKRQPKRFLDTLSDAIDATSGKPARSGATRAAVVAGTLAALTAVSARISSLRRRHEAAGSS
jgi:hypothetical protein